MKLRLFASLVVLCAFVAPALHAQEKSEPAKKGLFGKIADSTKNGVKKASKIRIGVKDDAKEENEKSVAAKENDDKATDAKAAVSKSDDTKAQEKSAPKAEQSTISTPKRGEPAKFTVSLSAAAACTKVRQYFVQNDAELEASDCASGQISTRPVVNTFSHAKRTIVAFIGNGASTEVRVKVMDKGNGFFSVNGGKQAEEKSEGVNIKDSVKMATQIQAHLQSATSQAAR